MSDKSNNHGRAYEFVCLHSLYDAINKIRPSQIIKNSSYEAAKSAWDTLSKEEKGLYNLSAKSTISTIFALEPNIIEHNNDILYLYIQSDENGEQADVRDIIIERKSGGRWEIGLSLKHNHLAVKHPRLAKNLDFGKKWYNIACSKEYWKEVRPIFEFLEREKGKGTYFRDIPSKENNIYRPILNAFINEIRKQIRKDKTVAHRLVEYLIGKYDFYKVVSIDNKRLTTIQSFNMYGTLNLPYKQTRPSLKAPKIKLPTTIIHIGEKPKSKTTIIMCFDNGWQFSFRIHNASSRVEPSLKFDIQIVGMPIEVNVKFNCKW